MWVMGEERLYREAAMERRKPVSPVQVNTQPVLGFR
jgi:hypothetical protein